MNAAVPRPRRGGAVSLQRLRCLRSARRRSGWRAGLALVDVEPLAPAAVRSPRSGAALFWQHICCIASRARRTGIPLTYGGDKPQPAVAGARRA